MNSFKEKLRDVTTKSVDERIKSAIIQKFAELESMTDVPEYQTQLHNRRDGNVSNTMQ